MSAIITRNAVILIITIVMLSLTITIYHDLNYDINESTTQGPYILFPHPASRQ